MLERKISPLEKKVDEIMKTLIEIMKKLPEKPLMVNEEVNMASQGFLFAFSNGRGIIPPYGGGGPT